MGCVSTSVMGPRLVSRSNVRLGPLNQMPTVWKDEIAIMDGITELPKRNRSLLLITLLLLVNNLDGEAKRNEMQNYLACMKHEEVMHAHSSRCITHIRIRKGGNYDCAGGFKLGKSNQPRNMWNTYLKQLSLQRDRTKLIFYAVAILSFLKSNIFFIAIGDTSARQQNNPEGKVIFL